MLRNFTIILTILLLGISINHSYATTKNDKITVEVQEGTIKLSQLLDASKKIANSVPAKFVNKSIPGKIIIINNKRYEIRYFSFETTNDKLPKDITFKEYVSKNNLMEMKSVTMKPLPGIEFESFDYKRAKLNDGVYFSMAVRLIIENKENKS